uniref:Uncharacterized protein n=1 Tax=Glossina palpalis gambiensis TaxID=67801 RepID=A0A1B0BCJ4_9MUSC
MRMMISERSWTKGSDEEKVTICMYVCMPTITLDLLLPKSVVIARLLRIIRKVFYTPQRYFNLKQATHCHNTALAPFDIFGYAVL